ncbi:unnamed protein product [Allacma fusca]|uniref:Uncharacterized protein n=1 Tax=Allacma fusca TaxID=39272 RepID=A0A8J2JX72_9HEXA|nr:unnamed protein product [Allacma fusca]
MATFTIRVPTGYRRVTCHCRQQTAILYRGDPGIDLPFCCASWSCRLEGKTGRKFLPLTRVQQQDVLNTFKDQVASSKIIVKVKPGPNSGKVEFLSIRLVEQEANKDFEVVVEEEVAIPECESESQLEPSLQIPNTTDTN